MEHAITEEEIARYRLPECFEYFEEARFFQYFTVRICLALFGPSFTRSIAEYFHFEKSKYPVYNDDEIRKLILQTKRPKLIAPTPKRLVGNIEEQIPTLNISMILHFLSSEDTTNVETILEDMRIHILSGELQQIFKLNEETEMAFTHQFNDIYLAHFLDKEADTLSKSRLKDLCDQYTNYSNSKTVIPTCETSAFTPYSRIKV